MYDIALLSQHGEINTESALKNFADEKEYSNRLLLFAENARDYLRACDPERVFRDSGKKDSVSRELAQIRDMLTSLGMESAVRDLNFLEEAFSTENSAMFAAGLTLFHARMDNLTKVLESAGAADSDNLLSRDTPIILAVDDKPEILSTVVNMLREKYAVLAATSGKAALKMIQKYAPSLFLLDIEMPLMNGYELASEIRHNKNFATVPIIFLTAKNSRDSVVTAIKHGGNDYIVKPVDKELLLAKMRRHLPI